MSSRIEKREREVGGGRRAEEMKKGRKERKEEKSKLSQRKQFLQI